MADDWFRQRWYAPHPHSPAGWRFDWRSEDLVHPNSPVGWRSYWPGDALPHPNSPVGDRFDWRNDELAKLRGPRPAPPSVEKEAQKLWWGYWKDYPKVRIGKNEYAKIGNRLYTRHAVDYLQPSGRRTIANIPTAYLEGGGYLSEGRSVPPKYVEETIVRGLRRRQEVRGVARTVHTLGDLEVVTEDNGKIVVTVKYVH